MNAQAPAAGGFSFEAHAEQTQERVTEVQATIMGILAEFGGLTHDELIEHYQERANTHLAVPWATESSIRSRTAELARRGLVRASLVPGVSRNGRKATRWVLA